MKNSSPPSTHSSAAINTDEVVMFLKEQVRLGTLIPGQRLIESDIVKMTGASRTRVRDAYKLLAAEGLIVIEEFKGASIRKLSRDEVLQIYQLREILEGFAARLAALVKWSVADKKALIKLQSRLNAAEQNHSPGDYKNINDEYHQLIRKMAGNVYIEQQLERLRLPMFHLHLHTFLDTQYISSSNADHRIITQSILDNDPAAAEKAMRIHIQNGRKLAEIVDPRIFM